MYCTQCGNELKPADKFCSKCGAPQEETREPVIEESVPATPVETLDVDIFESPELDQEAIYKAFLGHKNQDYYLDKFNLFDRSPTSTRRWNWSASLLTFYWFLYRKMWGAALFYFLLPYLLMIPLGIVAGIAGDSDAGDAIVGIGYLVYLLGIFIIPGIYGNTWYYRLAKKRIAGILKSTKDIEQQRSKLATAGGTSQVVLIIVVIFAVIAMIGILAAIAIPAYQDYVTRAKYEEANHYAQQATQSLTNYYQTYRVLPNTLDETGFNIPKPPSIQEIEYLGKARTLNITIQDSFSKEVTIQYLANVSNGQLVWDCYSFTADERLLPKWCEKLNIEEFKPIR